MTHAYANRIALLRSFYLRVSPELEPYFVTASGTRSPAPAPSAWQLTLTAAGMVAVVNSVVVAACAGLVLEATGVHSVAIPVGVGAVIGAAAFTLQERHTAARATPIAQRVSIGPRSSSRHRRGPMWREGTDQAGASSDADFGSAPDSS